jgi:Mn-dependent DtxR family transcriptional regulator
MAIHGVTAEYLNELAALGYRNLSAEELVSLRIHGVSADYVRRLKQNGMTQLSADQLVRLRNAGFEPRG